MEKYVIGKIQPTKMNKFEVIIVADSNDADYITTREFYSEEHFEKHIVDELIDLESNHSGEGELESFNDNYVSIPYGDNGCCHSLESVEVNYYDNNGTVRPVLISSGYYTVCHTCDYDLEDCVCEVEL